MLSRIKVSFFYIFYIAIERDTKFRNYRFQVMFGVIGLTLLTVCLYGDFSQQIHTSLSSSVFSLLSLLQGFLPPSEALFRLYMIMKYINIF